ncbi:hypothetical protein LCGC14_2707060, partial [marine sediment metagenome]
PATLLLLGFGCLALRLRSGQVLLRRMGGFTAGLLDRAEKLKKQAAFACFNGLCMLLLDRLYEGNAGCKENLEFGLRVAGSR